MEKRWIPASRNLYCEEIYRNTSQELRRDCKRDIIFSFLSNLPRVSCICLASEKRGCSHQILMGQLRRLSEHRDEALFIKGVQLLPEISLTDLSGSNSSLFPKNPGNSTVTFTFLFCDFVFLK